MPAALNHPFKLLSHFRGLVLVFLLLPKFILAQTESEAMSKYFSIKKHYAEGFRRIGPQRHEKTLIAYYCNEPPGMNFYSEQSATLPIDPLAVRLFSLASTVVQLRETAVLAGYPENTWRTDLIDFEERKLQEILRSKNHFDEKSRYIKTVHFYNETDVMGIITKMNLYWRSSPNLPKVESHDGCGAGGGEVVINLSPGSGRLLLTPEFFASLCEKTTGKSAYGNCPYWRETPLKVSLTVSGSYRYHARWSDGNEAMGLINFDRLLTAHIKNIKARTGESDDLIVTITSVK